MKQPILDQQEVHQKKTRSEFFKESGLIGCLNHYDITSKNYRDFLPFPKPKSTYKIKIIITRRSKGNPNDYH